MLNPAGTTPATWIFLPDGSHASRPFAMHFVSCTDVLVRDVRLVHTPSWGLVPSLCRRVTLTRISIHSDTAAPGSTANGVLRNGRWFVPCNCDGIDIDSSEYAVATRAALNTNSAFVRPTMKHMRRICAIQMLRTTCATYYDIVYVESVPGFAVPCLLLGKWCPLLNNACRIVW